jgi:hypothetical protein
MGDWTPAMVEARLESAADVFRSLPEVKPQGYFNAWPEYFHSFADQVGQEPRMRRPKPGPRDITQGFLPGDIRMLAGEARHIASDRAGFLGSHPEAGPPPEPA